MTRTFTATDSYQIILRIVQITIYRTHISGLIIIKILGTNKRTKSMDLMRSIIEKSVKLTN